MKVSVGVQRRAPVEIVDVGAIALIGIISLLELAIDRGAGVISARNRPPGVVGFFCHLRRAGGAIPRSSVS
jgi:hypothetical protein